MAGVLLLLFLIVPIVELYVIIQVGQAIGTLPTIALLIAVSVAGAWLVRWEGLGVWRRAQQKLQQGEMPTTALIDGVLILLAGALMLTPGFLTDLIGVLLLLPPSRAVLRGALVRRYRHRLVGRVSRVGGFGGPGGVFVTSRVYDVEDVGDVTPPEWRRQGSGELEGE
jgi:UPF0716 protein FxsA